MRRKICKLADAAFVVFVIAMAVYGFWVALMKLYYGDIQTRAVDGYIYVLLVCSLYKNYWYWCERKFRARVTNR